MSLSDDGAASSRRPSPPAWILLDNNAFINDWQNATTATACTSTGQPIRVTLAAAEPPRDSYFCVHCPSLTKKRKHGEDFPVFPWDMGPVPPTVVYSEGDLALLRVPLSPDDNPTDYFIYRAGRRPWLRLLPATFSGPEFVRYAPLGLMPIGGGDGGDHFAVAAISYVSMEGTHKLHVFRSDRGTWTTTPLVLGSCAYVVPTKVIAIGGRGELCWVDLRQCILVCDVLDDDDPKPRLIPLPKLLPSNQPDKGQRNPREYRDVVVGADGSITCVEIEHMMQRPDISSSEVLYDSELPLGTPPHKYEYHGWRIITWNRAVSSNCWRKRSLIHVDDIVENDPGHTAALLRPMAGDSGQGLMMRYLRTQVPSLNIHGGDLVYVMIKANQHDTKAWMLAVDMAKKTLEEVVPISAEESVHPSYLSCALTKYLENR